MQYSNEGQHDVLETLGSGLELIESVMKNPLVKRTLEGKVSSLVYRLIGAIRNEADQKLLIKYAEIIVKKELLLNKFCDFDFYGKITLENFNRYLTLLENPTIFQVLIANPTTSQKLNLEDLERFADLLSDPLVGPLVLAGKFNIANILKQNTYAPLWDRGKILEVAAILSHSSVKSFKKITAYDVDKWGADETIKIAQYAQQPAVKEFIDKGLLEFLYIRNLEELKAQVSILTKFQKDIQVLLENGTLEASGIHGLLNRSEEGFRKLIIFIERNAKYFQLGILSPLYFFSGRSLKSVAEFVEDLDQLPSSVLQFLAYEPSFNEANDYLLHANVREERKIYLDALTHPCVREALTSKALFPSEIVKAFKDKNDKESFLAALYNPAIMKRIHDSDDSVFKNKYKKQDRNVSIISVGRIISDPQVLPLHQLGYLTSAELVECRYWTPASLVVLAKYKLLLRLQQKVNNPDLKRQGLFGINFPDKIVELQKKLASLNEISTIKSDAEILLINTNPETVLKAQASIDCIFYDTFKILEPKPSPFKFFNHGNKVITSIYKQEYEKFLQLQKVGALGSHYKMGQFFLTQLEFTRAYENFIQVVETDPNYFDALWEAGNIAFAQAQYEEAKYLLSKALQLSLEKEDKQNVSNIKVLLDCIDKSQEGETYALSELPKPEVKQEKVDLVFKV